MLQYVSSRCRILLQGLRGRESNNRMAALKAIEGAGRRRLGIFTPGKILIVFLVVSVGQYALTGQVSWLTDSFRWLERTGRSVWADPVGSLGDVGQSVADAAKKTTRETSALINRFSKADAEALQPQPRVAWSAPAYDLSGRVVRVSDGDTLTILDGENRQHKIRLYGIDTPEWGQPFGRAAKRALSDRVSGEGVGIEVIDTDSYGRTVGVVYLGSEDINVAMVRSGYAWWYRRYAPFSDELRAAEQRARAEGAGLWSDPGAVPPWEWRRRRR